MSRPRQTPLPPSRPASHAEPSQARLSLRDRLQAARSEIEQVVLTRVNAISDSSGADPAYLEGLRGAISSALDYGMQAIEHAGQHPPAIPVPLLAQARIAARNGISLDVVLRRYFAGYTLLGDRIVQEAQELEMSIGELNQLLRSHVSIFDHLLAAVTEEYRREEKDGFEMLNRSRAERVRRLLEGELVDPGPLRYEFGGSHVGLVVIGEDAEQLLRELATKLDRRLLCVERPDRMIWAWLGGRSPIAAAEVRTRLETLPGRNVRLSLGEAGEDMVGWRQTHCQAKAALQVALRGVEPIIRYGDVALLASTMQDDLLSRSLRDLYLTPLEGERDGGKVAKATLRAYFEAARNVSSAAATLGVSRQAVTNRLRQIEERVGRPIDRCAGELEMALRLELLGEEKPPLDRVAK